MATPLDVAKYILTLSDDDSGELISNLKLQKLLYYCQGFNLAINETPLFDEEIEAWTHGPVVPSIYRTFKHYGSGAIEVPDQFDDTVFTPAEIDVINEVYTVYGQFSAWRLRNLTHEEPPYNNTPIQDVISKAEMKRYFKSILIDG